jgi:exonuclease VII large subunit
MSFSIESDLKEILGRLEQKIDKLSEDTTQKIDRLSEDTTQKIDRLSGAMEQKIDKLSEETNQKIDRLSGVMEQKIDKLAEETNRKIDKLSEETNRKLDNLSEDVVELKIGQAEIKGEIGALDERVKGINTRLDKVDISMQKIPELAEKVGEVKNWRQIGLIIVSAAIAGIIGYLAKNGRP